jgi:hypothetical protein
MAKMINDQDFVKQQMTGVAEHLIISQVPTLAISC